MSYFTTRETFFVIPLSTYDGEIQKIGGGRYTKYMWKEETK